MTDRAWPTAPKYPVRVINLNEIHNVDPVYKVARDMVLTGEVTLILDAGRLTDVSIVDAGKGLGNVSVETVIENVHPETAALMTGLPANRFAPPITELPAHIKALPEQEQGPALVQAIHDRKAAE